MTGLYPLLPGFRTLSRTATRDCPVALHRNGDEYAITSCQQILMTSEQTGSERALGQLAAYLVATAPHARVLVGGLGMGFTLRALLDRLPADARVVVSELLPAVARWNRERFGHLSEHPLRDPRVRLHIGDVAGLVRGRPMWDAIVLDVDNGPDWVVQRSNGALYSARGLSRLTASLRPGGVAAVWSAGPHPPFEQRISARRLPWRRYRSRSRQDSSGAVLYVIAPDGAPPAQISTSPRR